jgi:hypothetical protein
MDSKDIIRFKKWFDTYVKGFYSEDEDVQLHVEVKERHTYHVCDNIRNIGQSLKLREAELVLAEIIALFHDVGRFRQYQTYHTFNDKRSVNHAELSVSVLEELDVLKGLPAKEQEIIKKAVIYHNRRSLPDDEAADVLLFAKLIRDADKLDIFAMIIGENEDCKMVKSPELKESLQYSRKIVADVLDNCLALYEDIQTSADQMLFRASWVYGIYFPYSSRYILEKQYVQKMLGTLPQDMVVRQVTLHLEEYLKKAGAQVFDNPA